MLVIWVQKILSDVNVIWGTYPESPGRVLVRGPVANNIGLNLVSVRSEMVVDQCDICNVWILSRRSGLPPSSEILYLHCVTNLGAAKGCCLRISA